MRNFVLDQKLLGTVCFCDFSTPKVRNLIHTYLKKKYKTDKMPNMFLDLFSRNRSSEKYFGKTVIIFGFYVIFFTFDEFVDYLKNNMTPGKGPANTSKWGTKDFFGYLVNSFQEGINFRYPCSHFRFRKLGLDAVSKKIAIMLWLKKIRAEAIRREKSPSDDLKTDNEVKMLNFVCLDEIKSSRMVNMLRELVKKKFKVIIQPGEGADDFFSITCIPARVRHDRLVLAMNSKYEDNLPQTQKHYSLKCRFSFAGGKEKLRYYCFDTRMICTQELGRNITGLEVILPVDYSVSERQAPRYEMSSDDVKDVALWYFSTYSETPDISRAKPFIHYLEHYGLFNIMNISSGGIRISFARDLLNSLQKSFVLNEYYVIKLLLHQEDQLTEVARELRRNEEKPVNNEVYASLMKNVADSGKEQDPVHVGFQFIQEAHPGTGGRLNWIDIRDKGSWHVGNWLFSRSSHTR
ncbi:hypothetical protein [Desulfonatronovibrio magnus]|uniref:hypothetical protein n=1 Tax=Desulfonatronovibrio magnus TaxID=698827 RepID=UPI0005EB089A|nr:hypothetical protein [Desulfonatronovibrio magnus]